MLNRIILEGRLGADPERRQTTTGKIVARLPLPLFNPYQKDSDPTEWIQCEVWNQPADFITKYGKKGHLVSVEGRLRNQRYEDKEGNTRYSVYVAVDRITLLEPRNRQENNATTSNTTKPNNPPPTTKENTPTTSAQSDSPLDISSDKPSNIDDLFKDFDGIMNS